MPLRRRRDSIRVFRNPRTHLHLGLWTVGILIEWARRGGSPTTPQTRSQHLDDGAANEPPPNDDTTDSDAAEDTARSGAPPG